MATALARAAGEDFIFDPELDPEGPPCDLTDHLTSAVGRR